MPIPAPTEGRPLLRSIGDDVPSVSRSDDVQPSKREVTLTRASSIRPRPVRWLWEGRMALGTLTLLAGREGVGKSTLTAELIAQTTGGTLAGANVGQPKSVIVVATEDSWAHVLVPRLMAAGANLDRVFRVDVISGDGSDAEVSLPRDLGALEKLIEQVDASMIVLDPLMSRLSAKLDTHKDAEVRQALEPLTRIADRTRATVVGLIHVSKAATTDPLTSIMGSRAFTAVARSVVFVMADPDEETTRMVGLAKNNLGRVDLPTMSFKIESQHVTDTDEGPVWSSRLRWTGVTDRSVRDLLEATAATGGNPETRTAVAEAADWLEDHLTVNGGTDDSANTKKVGQRAGHSADALKRARIRLKATSTSHGFPRSTYWTLPGSALTPQLAQIPGEIEPTALTAPTGPKNRSVSAVSAVDAAEVPPLRLCTHCGWPRDSKPHIQACEGATV
jgi:hypothetical protein